jgi:predicted outer membrane repeat protein
MNTNQRFSLNLLAMVICIFAYSVSKGAVIYVDAKVDAPHDGQTWQTAFHHLNDALAIAGSGDEIRVAKGIYRPDETSGTPEGTGDRSAAFNLIDGITVYGAYAGFGAADPNERNRSEYETVLSGDLGDNDTKLENASQLLNDPNRSENSYHVITILNGTQATAVDGFTISGGAANGIEPDFSGGGILILSANPVISNCRFEYNAAVNGGAVYNGTAANPTLTNCTFLRNYAQSVGGAVRNTTSSSPLLTNCVFIENKAAGFGGAIANNDNCNPAILQCTFSYNWANQAGAINNYDSCNPQITQSVFRYNASDNTGGAIRNENHSDPELINCGFYTNTAARGAGLYNDQSNPAMVNCVASGNIAIEYGGVLYNRESINPGITNCTFVGNTAGIHGALLYNVLSSPTLQNCILWENSDPSLNPIFTESGSPSVTYSCIPGGWPTGTGNIDADPLFIDPNGPDGIIGTTDDNFMLFADSPCIDAGNNSLVPTDTSDLDNDANLLERIPLDFSSKPRFIDISDVPDTGVSEPPMYPYIIDMGAMERGGPIFVDSQAPGLTQDGTTWEQAFNHLQDALAISERGDVVWVAQGVYCPDQNLTSPEGTGDRSASFVLADGVAVKGGYAGWTQPDPNRRDIEACPAILSGDLLRNDAPVTDPAQMQTDPNRADNTYHVIVSSRTGSRTELNGFTIRSGHASDAPGTPNSFGAAMYNTASALVLANCSFQQNWATTGGALYNYGTSARFSECSFSQNAAADKGGVMRNTINSDSIFSDCIFANNSAGNFGGVISNNDHSGSTMTRCIFNDNTAASAAAVNNFMECNSSFTDCEFHSNQAVSYGGAVSNYDQSDSRFTRCIFSANSASFGGALYNDSSNPELINCGLYSNAGAHGAGLYNYQSDPVMVNCTIVSNAAGIEGSLLYNVLSSPAIQNCILWEIIDPNPSPILTESGSPSVSNSCIRGGWPGGTGNIDADPLFSDPNGPDGIPGTKDDNFRLTADSPCLDAADNTLISAGVETDLDGLSRIVDADCSGTVTADMGAYEFSYLPMGDFDLNCGIDFLDFAELANAWLTAAGDTDYNPACDIGLPHDNTINSQDLTVLSENWLLGK